MLILLVFLLKCINDFRGFKLAIVFLENLKVWVVRGNLEELIGRISLVNVLVSIFLEIWWEDWEVIYRFSLYFLLFVVILFNVLEWFNFLVLLMNKIVLRVDFFSKWW